MKHGFLMGKSMENLQCHRIYIQHIWRYGSRFLTPISGCSIRVYLILSSWYKNPKRNETWNLGFICDPLLWDFTNSDWRLRTRIQPSLQVPRQLLTPLRACWEVCLVIWWFCWGKKPLDLEKLATHKEDIFLLVANFHWFIIGIGCWFYPQTLVCCWKAPAVTSWSIISPTTIDHRHIMIRHDTSTISHYNPSYPAVIKHGTWTSPIYSLFSQLWTSIKLGIFHFPFACEVSPRCLSFGGSTPCWGRQLLDRWLRDFGTGRRSWDEASRRCQCPGREEILYVCGSNNFKSFDLIP